MKKYLGNYLGIVVNSAANDPENRNRVQIWIPHITNTLYEDWNDDSKSRSFYNNTYGVGLSQTNLISRLRRVLPWAECAAPNFGSGAPYVENPTTGRTSIDSAQTLEDPEEDNADENLPFPDADILAVEPTGSTEGLTQEEIDAGFTVDDQGVLIPPEANENISVDEPLPELLSETGSSSGSTSTSTESTVIIEDTPENNAPGSGEDMEPVEPDLPVDDEDTDILPLDTTDDDADYFPSTATRTDPSITTEGQTPDTVPALGGGGVVIQRQSEVATKRTGALGETLVQTIQNGLDGTGLNWVSTSGTGNYGVGNSQHKVGNATDGYFVYANNGTKLDPNNSTDKRNIANALYNLTLAGVGGVGWDSTNTSIGGTGTKYMGDDVFHLDVGGAGRNWGHSTGSDTAADWVIDARNGTYEGEQLVAGAGSQERINVENEGVAGEDVSDQPIETDDWGGANLASTTDGGYDGTSSGSFSAPDIGAKVWVFFHGGDIQKPVYFAQALDAQSYGQTQQGILFDNIELTIT
jgi:hypothetical protein